MKHLKALFLFLAAVALASSATVYGNDGPVTIKGHPTEVVVGLPELPAPAASVTINLSSYPKAITANGKKVLSELFTVAEAKAAFPDCFRAMQTMRQWTDAQVMGLALFNAMYTDAVWRGAQHQTISNSAGVKVGDRILSRNRVVCDVYGAWWQNDYLYYAFGTYDFPNGGPGNAADGGDLGGFEILHWHERWAGPGSNRAHGDRVLFSAQHGGSDVLVDYSEGTWFNGALRIDGRAGNYARATGPPIVGIEFWDFGEVSSAPGLFVHHCDIGVRFARSTPGNCPYTMSCFSNNVAGFEFAGGIANLDMSMLSGDDNPDLWRMVPMYGRPATFNGHFDCVKSEWSVTEANIRLWKPQHYEMEGRFRLTIDMLTYASTHARTSTMFRVNPTIDDSYIHVQAMEVYSKWGPDYLLVDLANRKAWKYTAYAIGFEYSSLNGGKLTCWPVPCDEVPLPYTGRSGYVALGAQLGADGSPFWDDVTGNGGTIAPPATTCTYTYSPWSTCINGTQNRTVTSKTPTGCTTPAPVTSQSCTVTTNPVLTWATTFSGLNANTLVATTGTNVSVSQAWMGLATAPNGTARTLENTQFPRAITGVRRVVLKGLTLTAPVRDYAVLNSVLKVRSDGRITAWDGTTVLATVTPGVRTDVTLNLPTATDLTYVLGMKDQPCAAATIESMEVYK